MPDSRRVLAFDYGQRRIGVACGQTLTGNASPLTTLDCPSLQPDWQLIEKLISDWQPDVVVVGLPRRQDGSDSDATIAARAFADELQRRFQVRTDLHDETLSSRAAESILREQRRDGRRARVQKTDVDRLAAALILQSWLDENTGAFNPPAQ